ncbi:MAG TPA: hypothetical protein VFU11_04605 [Solirubrobacterales bacterium]|nr:hypothetical protein [Solirubrobacterales bacterium]
MPINFYELIGDGDLDGARAKFERLVIAIAHVKHQAMGVAARPGDWGIDAFFGDLDGMIAIWQAKYFMGGVEEAQKKQIRDSFKSALKAAEDHEHEVEMWTLCLPIDLDPDATAWWQKWKRRQERDHGVVIDLWGRTKLEGLLLTPECIHLARHYFPGSVGATAPAGTPEILPLPDDHGYDGALFVRQLEAAEVAETESAKRQFFNYETLARDVADKGDPIEKNTLTAVEAEVHALWETCFGAASHDPETGIDPNLVAKVMGEIKANHGIAPPRLPPMSFLHHMGTMHRVVENGEAGWVAHFRQIAESYRA